MLADWRASELEPLSRSQTLEEACIAGREPLRTRMETKSKREAQLIVKIAGEYDETDVGESRRLLLGQPALRLYGLWRRKHDALEESLDCEGRDLPARAAKAPVACVRGPRQPDEEVAHSRVQEPRLQSLTFLRRHVAVVQTVNQERRW